MSTSVARHEAAMITARKTPTVLYGRSGERSSGRKPMAMTSALRVMARAGSVKSARRVAVQPPVSAMSARVRWIKWIAKSTERPSVSELRTAIGMS